MEPKNGKESLQAFVLYSTQEGFNKALTHQSITFKSVLITFKQPDLNLKQVSEKFNIILNTMTNEEKKKKINLFREQGIIIQIRDLLKNINIFRNQYKQVNGRWPTISANDLLLTKYSCDILNIIICQFSSSKLEILQVGILSELMIFIHSLPVTTITQYNIILVNNLIRNANNQIKIELQQNQGVQILSQLLEHSNIFVKQNIVSSIENMIILGETRINRRQPHPLFEEMRRDRVIFLLQQNYIISNGIEQQYNQSDIEWYNGLLFIILGQFLRAQVVQQNLKQNLFNQLKKGLQHCQDFIQQNSFDVICGLAINDDNIPEIIKDNFIDVVVEQTRSQVEIIKSYALELLLILAQKGGIEIEKEIQSKTGEFNLLELIGDLDLQQNQQVLDMVLKWSNNEQLKKIQKLFNIMNRFNNSNRVEKKDILTEQLIPSIIAHLTKANQEILQSEQNEQLIPQITIGTINSCCLLINQLSINNIHQAREIINSGLLTQLQILLNHIPILHSKKILFQSFQYLMNHSPANMKQFLFKQKIIQSLCRFFDHPSINLIEFISSSIQYIILSGNVFASPNDNFQIILPITFQQQFYNEMKEDGSLEILEQIIINNKFKNEFITRVLNMSLINLYRGQPLPSNLLNKIIPWMNEFIENNLEQFKQNNQNLKFLFSFMNNQENHLQVLNSNFLKTLISIINQCKLKTKKEILTIITILYERGNENTRQKIKTLIQLEQIQAHISRDNLIKLYYQEVIDEEIQYKNEKQQFYVNRLGFALIAWFVKEDKMNEISKLKSEIEQQNNKLINIDNKQQNKEENIEDLINQQWDLDKKMISIAHQLENKELFQGAMTLVQDAIYYILFQSIKKKQEKQFIISINNFHQILENSNNETYFNLINLNICRLFSFQIKNSQNGQQLNIIQLVNVIAEQGIQMNINKQFNLLSFLFFDSNIYYSLKQIVLNNSNSDENELKRNQKQEIQLYAAIGISLMAQNHIIEENLLNKCIDLFKSKLKTIVQNLKNQPTTNKKLKKADNVNINKIDDNEIKLIDKVIKSIGCISMLEDVARIMIFEHDIYNLIIPLIHLNCKCLLNKSFINSPFISILISSVYYTLSKFVHTRTEIQINELNIQNNLIAHITQSIITNFDQIKYHNTQSPSPKQSLIQINQDMNYSFCQINASFILLYELMIKSNQIVQSISIEPNLISLILQIAMNEQNNKLQSETTQNLRLNCFYIINSINKAGSLEVINWIGQDKNILILILQIICSAGGYKNDEDDILKVNIENLSSLYENLQNKEEEEAKNLLNDIQEEVEENGLNEEIDDLIFHSDNREDIGIEKKAIQLKNFINNEENQEDQL